ncbi:MAG: adenine phosphoribosyltransferase [Rickettsiales bacterium]|nr:adenine phosphoribosyltransferase [Rickettsiales bacterium]OUV53418.1 MAG: adenine phosphoribosyltransferase [Rickettsiales bacterium TMED127]|tara:strand:- start:20483 stop:20995 length:513 start_codon:yes stop_codon:yes gene_type:complete
MDLNELESIITKIPDYPKPGILFYDISPVINNAEAFSFTINKIKEKIVSYKIDKIAAIDARGFIFGAAVAQKMNLGLTLIRKIGKLPGKVLKKKYDLEYGTNTLEANPLYLNGRVALIDDLLATGGTAKASIELIRESGAEVTCFCTFIELEFLSGKDNLDVPYESIIKY